MALALGLFVPGCRGSHAQTAQAATNAPSGDPSDVNDAAAQSSCPSGQVLMSDGSCGNADAAPAQPAAGSTPTGGSAPQAAAPPPPQPAQQQPQYQQPQYQQEQEPNPADYSDDSGDYETQNAYDNQTYDQAAYNEGYQQGYEQGIQANQPPPALPVYAQPGCPGPGYLWNPGYWYWGSGGYYWVPGVWVMSPYTGALWTPGWWGFFGGFYRFHHGYWGSHIGFYGGIPYGYGYTGSGYHGGYWDHDRFMYNRSVTNITNVRIVNVYNAPVPRPAVMNRVSYNGGRGGLNVRPTRSEFVAMREPHVRPLPAQVTHRTQAMQNRQSFASVNHGRPPMAVATRPLTVRPIKAAPTVVNPGVHGATRPTPAAGRPGARPATPAPGARPNVPARPNTPARPNEPVSRPGGTPSHTQPVRPATPTPTARPAPQNRPTPVVRPQEPTHTAPQPARPAPQQRPTAQPQQRPTAQPQPARPAPQPRPETRPTPQPQRQAPQPRPEMRPTPQPQRETSQPQARPEPQRAQPREAPRESPRDDHPHR